MLCSKPTSLDWGLPILGIEPHKMAEYGVVLNRPSACQALSVNLKPAHPNSPQTGSAPLSWTPALAG